MKTWLVIVVLVLAGCSSTGIVPMDKDTYMVSKRSAQVGFGPAIGAKADVYQEANDLLHDTLDSLLRTCAVPGTQLIVERGRLIPCGFQRY